MIKETNELLIELWARLKSHIPAKERLDAADIMVVVFDEFGLISDDLLDEDLDKPLRAAVHSHLAGDVDEHLDEEDTDE